MSRLVDLAREKIRYAERANGTNLGIAVRDLCRAVDLLADAVETLEERADEHSNSSDSHQRLV